MGLEELLNVLVVTFLDRSAVAVPSVVDQHIDGAEPFQASRHRGLHLLLGRDIEGDGKSRLRVLVSQVFHLAGIPGGDDRVVPAGQHGLGEGPAESGRTASDQPSGHQNPSSDGLL